MCRPGLVRDTTSHAQMTRIHPVYECASQRAARIDTILTEVNGWITSRLREITFPRGRNMPRSGLVHTYAHSPLSPSSTLSRLSRTNIFTTRINIYQENSYFDNFMNFLLIFCILFSFFSFFLVLMKHSF